MKRERDLDNDWNWDWDWKNSLGRRSLGKSGLVKREVLRKS